QALAEARRAPQGPLRARRLSILVGGRARARAARRRVEVVLIAAALAAAGWAWWRFVWFWRNPARKAPAGAGVLSAADGTVVYVKTVAPGEDVVSIKQGLAAKLTDLVHEDASHPKLVIGVFMSPFDVHYNRAPVSGSVELVRHYPGR